MAQTRRRGVIFTVEVGGASAPTTVPVLAHDTGSNLPFGAGRFVDVAACRGSGTCDNTLALDLLLKLNGTIRRMELFTTVT